MSIAIQNENNTITAIIKGRIDTLTSHDIEHTILELFTGDTQHIILDIKNVDYVSSAGLRVFILAQKKANSVSIKLSIKGIQDQVYEVFSISGLIPLFNFD